MWVFASSELKADHSNIDEFKEIQEEVWNASRRFGYAALKTMRLRKGSWFSAFQGTPYAGLNNLECKTWGKLISDKSMADIQKELRQKLQVQN